jgi:CubicO group peptidase (beta-lactamase class C family)
VPTLTQVLNGEKPANTPPIRSETAPGANWTYSGGGFTILQQAVIDSTHEAFPKLMRDTVFTPIDMNHSTYEQPLPEALKASAATPYGSKGEAIPGGAHTYPEMAAAGLWTTPSDLARYAIEVQQSLEGKANHVLSQEMTRQMLTPGLGHWGLGLEIGGAEINRYFTHDGSNQGFRCTLVAYEKGGDGAVVMTNADGGGPLGDEIINSIAAEYGWPDFHPIVRSSIQVDPKILAQYTGTFAQEKGFSLVIGIDDGKLTVQTPSGDKFPLYAKSETIFFPTVLDGEIEFVKDAQGNVAHLVLHQQGHDTTMTRKSPGK